MTSPVKSIRDKLKADQREEFVKFDEEKEKRIKMLEQWRIEHEWPTKEDHYTYCIENYYKLIGYNWTKDERMRILPMGQPHEHGKD